jgi:hypothetical protein
MGGSDISQAADNGTDKVFSVIARAGEAGIGRAVLHQATRGLSNHRREAAIAALLKTGRIYQREKHYAGGGRPATVFSLAQK